MSEGGDDIRAKLAEIAGGVKLIDNKLDQSNRLHDERHETVRGELRDIRETQHRHSNRIGTLEAARHLNEGERKGIATSTKVAVGIATLLAGSVGAAIARLIT